MSASDDLQANFRQCMTVCWNDAGKNVIADKRPNVASGYVLSESRKPETEYQKVLDLKAIFEPDELRLIEAAESCPTVESFPTVESPKPPRAAVKIELPDSWPAALADFVLLLAPDDLPPTPFEFGGPHCVVVDRRKFLAAKQADIRRGPAGPRAMYGAIQGDLRRFQDLLTDD